MTLVFLSTTIFIICVGAILAFQAPANAALARNIGDPVWAAALSFAIGFVLLAAFALLRGTTPQLPNMKGLSWWALSGGALGAIWVLAAIWSVPKLGAVTMFSAMILGQLIAAILIDSHGTLGLAVQNISTSRVFAVLLVFSGVLLSMR